jgi:nitrite reductase/ring-hydroxylating ferredoxin subunit
VQWTTHWQIYKTITQNVPRVNAASLFLRHNGTTQLGDFMPSRRNVLKGSILAGFAALLPARALGQVASKAAVKACKTSAIPLKGGKIVTAGGQTFLITQPSKGVYRAFSATCTHNGCAIGPWEPAKNAVVGGVVTCNCHGAQFSPVNGSAVRGPAQAPLKKYTVKVTGNYLYVS